MFGKGKHNIYQFTDEELRDIDDKVISAEHEKVIFSFHGPRMCKDAARYKIFKQTGRFPQVTKATGLASLREVLSEDASFPATRQQLLEHQGWKIIDLSKTRRVRASEVLSKLPEKAYSNIDQVLEALEGID